jgi:hypothetical protein
LQIKFNLSNDSIACFLGQKENTENKNNKVARSLKKNNRNVQQTLKQVKNLAIDDSCKL